MDKNKLTVQHFQLPDRHEEEYLLVHAETVASKLGDSVSVSEFEQLWNENLLELLAIEEKHPHHKWYVGNSGPEHYYLIPKLFFAVLGKFIKKDDEVTLIIPAPLEYRVFFIGWRLERGTLHIRGNPGGAADNVAGTATVVVEGSPETVGREAHGDSRISVNGDVTYGVGDRAYGNSVFEIQGNVDSDLGGAAYDNARFIAYGDVRGNVGQAAKGYTSFLVMGDAALKDFTTVGKDVTDDVSIEIMGNAGRVGMDAAGNARILVHGNAGELVGYGAKGNAHITIEGSAGNYVGEKAQGKAYIEVFGDAGNKIGQRAYRTPTIIVHGHGEAGEPNKSFTGILKIGDSESL